MLLLGRLTGLQCAGAASAVCVAVLCGVERSIVLCLTLCCVAVPSAGGAGVLKKT